MGQAVLSSSSRALIHGLNRSILLKCMREKSSMEPDQRERYVRWQNYRVTQLSFATNLFLGFAVASLAFVINIKLENKSHGVIPIDALIVWWAACAVLGCIATISKLLDYRFTALKIKDGGAFNECTAKYCGLVTWGCFWGQVSTFAIGAYLFITGIVAK